MRFRRIAIVLATSLTLGGSLGAQDVEPTAVETVTNDQPRVLGRRPDANPDLELPVTPPGCIDRWTCVEASAIEAEPLELAEYALPIPDEADTQAEPEMLRQQADNTATGEEGPPRARVRTSRGVQAREGAAPWMAQIQRPVRDDRIARRALDWEDRQFCGGALIASGWILTAAHCLKDGGVAITEYKFRVRLGVTNIQRGETGATYRIVATYPHKDYNPRTYANDIALIRIASDGDTGTGRIRIQRVRLDEALPAARKFTGQVAEFFGWGRTIRDRPSGPLQLGRVRLLADTDCNSFMKFQIALCGKGYGAIGATQCKGDSGGPLIWRDAAERPVLVGVVSHNTQVAACGQQTKPGVFTRVAYYKPWIEKLTGPLP